MFVHDDWLREETQAHSNELLPPSTTVFSAWYWGSPLTQSRITCVFSQMFFSVFVAPVGTRCSCVAGNRQVNSGDPGPRPLTWIHWGWLGLLSGSQSWHTVITVMKTPTTQNHNAVAWCVRNFGRAVSDLVFFVFFVIFTSPRFTFPTQGHKKSFP